MSDTKNIAVLSAEHKEAIQRLVTLAVEAYVKETESSEIQAKHALDILFEQSRLDKVMYINQLYLERNERLAVRIRELEKQRRKIKYRKLPLAISLFNLCLLAFFISSYIYFLMH